MHLVPLVLYAAAAAAYIAHFAWRDPRTGRFATAILGAGLLAHTFLIGMQTVQVGHAPLVGTTAAISAFVWLLGISYLYVEVTTEERAMGMFVAILMVVLFLIPALDPQVSPRPAVLRSPLFGLSEEALFELAYDRAGASLYQRLHAASHRPPFAEVYERLRALLAQVDFLPPFEFYVRLLGEGGGRRRLLARLGPAAAEPIEAFLAQALVFEQGHPPSMQAFLHWLRADETELIRDPDLIYPAGSGFGFAAGTIANMFEGALALRYPQRADLRFVRLGKPNTPIFEEAMRRAGTTRAVMIGDQLETDITGARAAGLDAVWIETGVTAAIPEATPHDMPRPSSVAPIASTIAGSGAAKRRFGP